jgi:hypothetical protein
MSDLSDTGDMETNKQQRNTPSRDIDIELGRRAHMLIWDAKRTQGDVAAELGMTSGSLGLKLKGSRGWALAEIVGLAQVLNTSVAYLVGEIDSPHGPPVGPTGLEPMTSTV